MLSVKELQSSTEKELLLELMNARVGLMKIRISVRTKHEKNTSKKRKEKRYIAQILTVLNELDAEVSAEATAPREVAMDKKAMASTETKVEKSKES